MTATRNLNRERRRESRMCPAWLVLFVALVMGGILLTGCSTLSLQGRGTSASSGEGGEGQVLDLSGLDLPANMPEDIDKRSVFDLVTAAAYLSTVKPGEAADAYG